MIKVIEKKKSKQKPYYLLEFNYMIGDADGHTEEKMKCPIKDADVIERFVTLVNGLKPLKGTWGIVFEKYDFNKFLKEGQLNQEDYDFLKNVMFWDDEEKDMNGYFADYIKGEAEYSFLVFEGVGLYYYDENGVKHETKIV
jgi:hypothetical protein